MRQGYKARAKTWVVSIIGGLLAVPIALGGCSLDTEPTGPPPPADADLSILFIGNSLTFTNDLPGMLARLLEAEGGVGTVYTEMVAFPNFGLEDHWVTGARGRIAAGGWDVVVLQQGPSATEGRPSLLEYSQRFAQEIARVGARTALYMVWPARIRDFDFDGVSDSYETAARQVGGLLFPAGEAWRSAWARDPDLGLYGGDGFHPTRMGTYLAALVMYEQLSGRDPHGLPSEMPSPGGSIPLEPEVASLLHDAAVDANAEFALP